MRNIIYRMKLIKNIEQAFRGSYYWFGYSYLLTSRVRLVD